MTTDWRALCVELVRIADALDGGTRLISNQGQALDGYSALAAFRAVADRARAALAEPAPPWPTRDEAVAVYTEVMAAHDCQTLGDMAEHFARAVLARWGHQPAPPAEGEQRHPEPVPVSERLPGAEDCDAEGRCWWFCFECPGEYSYWILAKEVCCDPTYWLPANALPLPAGEVEPNAE